MGMNLTRPQNVKVILEKIKKTPPSDQMFFNINRAAAINEAMVGINMRAFAQNKDKENFRKA